MSFWGGLRERWLGGGSVKLSGRDDPETMAAAPMMGRSHSGQSVTPSSVMNLSTAWRCVRLRSRVIGAMPLQVHERLAEGGSQPAKDHWLYGLIHRSPNADQTPAEFWGGMVACRDLWGNAYAKKERVGDRIVALNPLRPDRVTVRRKEGPGSPRVYRYSGGGSVSEYPEEDVLHLRGFTLGGDVGLSAVEFGRHSLGLGQALEETAGKTFENGLQLAGFLQEAVGGRSNNAQRKELMEMFAEFAGSKQAGKVMPLPTGWEFKELGMKPGDAQLLESRGFSVEEICRWFDTPPILAGHAGKGQTMWGSGVEQILLGWLTVDLDPVLTGTEQAIMKQLLPPQDLGRFYVEYLREAMLQADSAGKAAFLSTMTQNGLMTRNEGRAKLNLRPDPEGDRLTVQSALLPLGDLGKAAASPEAQARSALQNWITGGIDDLVALRVREAVARLAPKGDEA